MRTLRLAARTLAHATYFILLPLAIETASLYIHILNISKSLANCQYRFLDVRKAVQDSLRRRGRNERWLRGGGEMVFLMEN
jgi:hypothetical protein